MSKLEERYGRIKLPVYDGSFSSYDAMTEAIPGVDRYFKTLKKCWRIDVVNLVKYIFFMYDPKSDLVNEYPDDLELRKEVAALDAGYQKYQDEFPEFVTEIFEFKDTEAVKFILEFLQVSKNDVWREWMMSEQELFQLYKIRGQLHENLSIEQIKKKAELGEQCKVIITRIKALKEEFYGDNRDLQDHTQDNLIPVTPENVFEVLNIPAADYKYLQVGDVSK